MLYCKYEHPQSNLSKPLISQQNAKILILNARNVQYVQQLLLGPIALWPVQPSFCGRPCSASRVKSSQVKSSLIINFAAKVAE